MEEQHSGSCLCGAIRFVVRGALKPPDACHCNKCRKFSGHYLCGTDILRENLDVSGQEHLRWYQSSEKVRRGFCSICGSSLFFDPLDLNKHNWTSVCMGAFDSPTNVAMALHIFVDDKGDYYEICDDLPQNAQ